MTPADLYERDFYAWTQDQAARLRALASRNDGLDIENLAEEVESLGRSDRRAAESLLKNIMIHLLKLRLHPDQQARGHWEREIDAFRDQLEPIFRESPSLCARRQEIAEAAWPTACRLFSRDLQRGGITAPRQAPAPFDLDTEVLNDDWFPPPA